MKSRKDDSAEAAWKSKDESDFFVRLFWYEMKLLFVCSVLCALIAFSLDMLGIFNTHSYQFVDSEIILIFQGFSSLSHSFENNRAIRFYLYCMSLCSVFILVKVAKKTKAIDFRLDKLKNRTPLLLLASGTFILNWAFLLFNYKVIAESFIGRGLIVYAAIANNFFLLAILGWMFYFFIVVSFTVILKITAQFKQSY